MHSKKLETVKIILAVIGLVVSIYLVISQQFNLPVACPQTGVINCDKVLGSIYSHLFGIPNSYLGLIFFILVLVLVYMKKQVLLALWNTIGIGFVFYFLYAEYMLGAICPYCTVVHIVTISLFAISVFELKDEKELKLF